MAIQKHNTYYDTTKPNSGIYCYDENGNHKEVLTKNDLNAISSISSINDKVTTLSSKTVSEIKSTDTVTATPHTAPDGTIYYELEAAPEVSDTEIYGENGISAKNQGTKWTIGLSADYLSANALNNLSGNWQSTYNTVKSNSSVWDTVKDRVYSADFIPVKDDVDVLKANSAHYTVESTNEYITVDSVGKTYRLTFVSGDLATRTWVEEQIADFGGFEIAPGDGDGKPIVQTPNPKKIYLVKSDPDAEDAYSEWIWVETAGVWDWTCIGETSIDLKPYLTKAEASAQYLTILSAEEIYQKKLPDSADFVPYSGKGIVSVKDHIISADSATPIAGSGIALDWDGNNYTISVSGDYLSANSLADLSGRWESAYSAYSNSSNYWNESYNIVNNSSNYWNSATNIVINSSNYWNSASNIVINSSYYWNSASEAVSNSSYYWNSATTIVNNSAEYWSRTYSSFIVFSAETNIDLDEINEQLQDLYDNVMITSGLEYDENGKIAAYMGSAFLGQEYLPGEGIDITNNIISVSGPYAQSGWVEDNFQPKGDYLSANALNNLSGNWESTYKTVSTNSATWEKVKDLHNVELSSTNSSIGITATTAEDGTVKYDLSVDEVAVPDISGENGVSARYDEDANGYIVGLEHSSLTYFEGQKVLQKDDLRSDDVIVFDPNYCTVENMTLENGVFTIPDKVEKVTFSINETVEDNVLVIDGVPQHTYQLNKITLCCGGTELLSTQDYYPNEVGFNELTLTYTIDNSKKSSKNYTIKYEGTPITDTGKITFNVSIIEEVQTLTDGQGGEGKTYHGVPGNLVVVDNNNNLVYLDGETDHYSVKTDGNDNNPGYLVDKITSDSQTIVASKNSSNQLTLDVACGEEGQVLTTHDMMPVWEDPQHIALSGDAPIYVSADEANTQHIGLNYDPDQFAVSGEGLHSTLQIKIITSGGIIDQEAFEKISNLIYGRITETIPIGMVNSYETLGNGGAFSYLFRPTMEFDVNSGTKARIMTHNCSVNISKTQVAISELNESDATLTPMWWSEIKTLTATAGTVALTANPSCTETRTLYPDRLYYASVINRDQETQYIGFENKFLTDAGNYDIAYWDEHSTNNGRFAGNLPYSLNGIHAGDLGQTGNAKLKPYIAFRNEV